MEVSVNHAAEVLGVSSRRVRQLIESGQVGARRVGSQWLVDGSALRAAPRRGRPMSLPVIWSLLDSPTPPRRHASRWTERRERLLEDPGRAELLASWAAARGERATFTTREPVGVLEDACVLPSGVSDPRAGISAADVVEGYVRRAELEQVRRRHLLRPAVGRVDVILHVVDDLPSAPVSRLTLAADLAEHGGPRESARANELIVEALSS